MSDPHDPLNVVPYEVYAEARAEADRLRDLLRRVVQGWGSDEGGCIPENYAAFEEAIATLESTGEERSDA